MVLKCVMKNRPNIRDAYLYENDSGIRFGDVVYSRDSSGLAIANANVTNKSGGLYFGLHGNAARDRSGGVYFGLLGDNVADHSDVYQIGPINLAERSRAIQLGFRNNSINSEGVQVGFQNYVDDNSFNEKEGDTVQIGMRNHSDGARIVRQFGLQNYTEHLDSVPLSDIRHLQFGFGNYADALDGLQIGLFNISDSSGSGLQFGGLNASRSERTESYVNQVGLICYAEDGDYNQFGLLTIRKQPGDPWYMARISPFFGWRRESLSDQ